MVPRQFVLDYVEHIRVGHRCPNRYLSGPGGVGKTTTLLLMVNLLLRDSVQSSQPCLVLYLPSCGSVVEMPVDRACREVVDCLRVLNRASLSVHFKDLERIIYDDALTFPQKWKKIVHRIMDDDPKWRVFVALDQWNALFDSTDPLPENHPLKEFDRIAACLCLNFTMCTAVSSSFTSLTSNRRGFRDDEIVATRQIIEPLSLNECFLLRDIWPLRAHSTPKVTDEAMMNLRRQTGGIPRLMEYYYRSIVPGSGVSFEDSCREYYQERFRKLHAKWSVDPILIQRFNSDIALLCLRKSIPHTLDPVSNQWLLSGLLKQSTTESHGRVLEAVNEFVLEAVDSTP